jgi:hypothetical protein
MDLPRDLEKAALRSEPSYVWRAGQQRRLEMILAAAGERIRGTLLENGCGVGMYVEHLSPLGGRIFGLEYDVDRTCEDGRTTILKYRPVHLNQPKNPISSKKAPACY